MISTPLFQPIRKQSSGCCHGSCYPSRVAIVATFLWNGALDPLREMVLAGTVLTLKRLGGAMMPPLDISRDYSATRKALATTLYDNFLSSFPHILTPDLWRPGVRFRSYITFCTCTSDRKWLKDVILCTKSMQIEGFFLHLVHINMLIFYSQWLKLICFSIIVLQKVSATYFAKNKNKNKWSKKTKKYIRNT